MKKRVYIAGPMTGVEDENFPAFDAAEVLLRGLGYEVFNPASLGHSQPGRDRRWFMLRDMPELLTCDAIALLPGWHASEGAKHELHTARLLKMTVLDATTGAVFNEPITAEAQRLTTRDRRDVYGHPFEDFSRIAQQWQAVLGCTVTPEQVALCMIQLKIGRLCESPHHRDSIVDIAGYANCLDMIRQRRESGG